MSNNEITFFYIFIIGESKSGQIKVSKSTFDKKSYFNIPSDKQDPIFHKHVTDSSKYEEFIQYLKDKKDKEKRYYRHLFFKIYNSKSQFTEEARFYLNNQLQFELLGYLLQPEDEYLANVNVTNNESLSKDQTLSSKQLLELYGNSFF